MGRCDSQWVDVIAEGLPIDGGATVVVTKARGNRVVVRGVWPAAVALFLQGTRLTNGGIKLD